MRADPGERFWAKVTAAPQGDCWDWRGTHDGTGYGVVRIDGRLHKAHRVAWTLTYGSDPGPRLWHRCHHPGCVRPAHLSIVAPSRPARAVVATPPTARRGVSPLPSLG